MPISHHFLNLVVKCLYFVLQFFAIGSLFFEQFLCIFESVLNILGLLSHCIVVLLNSLQLSNLLHAPTDLILRPLQFLGFDSLVSAEQFPLTVNLYNRVLGICEL
jgi:hypothetical protein